MPQLIPFFFLNQAIFNFLLLTIIIYIFSKSILARFVRLFKTNSFIILRWAANVLSGRMLPGNPHGFKPLRKESAAVTGLSMASPGLTVTILGMLNSNGINIDVADVDVGVYGLVHPTQNQIGGVIDSIGNNIEIIISLFLLISVAMGVTWGFNALVGLNPDLIIDLLNMALLELCSHLENSLASLVREFASDTSGYYAERVYSIRRNAYLLRTAYQGLLFFASLRGRSLIGSEVGEFRITRATNRVDQILSDLGIE